MTKTKLAILGTVLAVLISGGFYYAQAQSETTGGGDKPKMIEKMIEDGVVTQEQADKMKDYAQNFRKENRKQIMEERITSAVEDGTITEDEATQIRNWQNSRPEAMDKIMPSGGKGMHKGGMME